MQDFNSLYESSKRELEQIRQKKAVLQSKISELVKSLGLDESQDLQPQIEAMKAKLVQKEAQLNDELQSILNKIEALRDESGVAQ